MITQIVLNIPLNWKNSYPVVTGHGNGDIPPVHSFLSLWHGHGSGSWVRYSCAWLRWLYCTLICTDLCILPVRPSFLVTWYNQRCLYNPLYKIMPTTHARGLSAGGRQPCWLVRGCPCVWTIFREPLKHPVTALADVFPAIYVGQKKLH